jgi:uncharacterized phage-associated protein
MPSANIHDVADYVITKLDEGDVGLNLLKLQKLLYYIQGWHLGLKGEALFAGKFQAWIHGPVNRQIYDRFTDTHMMYAQLTGADVRHDFDFGSLSKAARGHIDEVLEAYAALSGTQLEDMTHDESPWIKARGKKKPSERCENELDEALMAEHFRSELTNTDE